MKDFGMILILSSRNHYEAGRGGEQWGYEGSDGRGKGERGERVKRERVPMRDGEFRFGFIIK
jgi:hypothetical protein